MSTLKAEIPLVELLRLGGTADPQVLAGHSGLNGPVAWVNVLSGAHPDDFPPEPAGLVLLTPPYPALWEHLRRLKQQDCAGVALLQPNAPAEVIAWANEVALPLLSLPPGCEVASLQRDLLRWLVDAEAAVIARAAELFQRLARLSVENEGVGGMACALADFANRGVLVHDKRLNVLAAAPCAQVAEQWPGIVEWSCAARNLPPEFLDRKRAAEIRQPIWQEMEGEAARLALPIIVRGMARGFLSVVGRGEPFDRLDRIALEQGAAACALEMAKVKAVSETRKQLTGDLIEAVLTNSVNEIDAGRWAERAGYRRAGPHVALALQWASNEAPSLRRLETLVSGEVKRMPGRAVAEQREGEIVVFYALDPERGFPEAQKWAERVYALAGAEFPHAHLTLGIGRPSETLLGLRRSYREAAQAMALERRLRHRRPQYFGDLGIYRLLLQLDGSPELRAFSSGILAGLIEYDHAQGTNLVETLRAYFRNNANLAQTAQALYIHRNTLLYRLQRAAEIGKFELDNPETRLAIQLALRAYELSRDEGEFLPPL